LRRAVLCRDGTWPAAVGALPVPAYAGCSWNGGTGPPVEPHVACWLDYGSIHRVLGAFRGRCPPFQCALSVVVIAQTHRLRCCPGCPVRFLRVEGTAVDCEYRAPESRVRGAGCRVGLCATSLSCPAVERRREPSCAVVAD